MSIHYLQAICGQCSAPMAGLPQDTWLANVYPSPMHCCSPECAAAYQRAHAGSWKNPMEWIGVTIDPVTQPSLSPYTHDLTAKPTVQPMPVAISDEMTPREFYLHGEALVRNWEARVEQALARIEKGKADAARDASLDLARAIWADVCDRSGFNDDVGEDVLENEILPAWAAIIRGEKVGAKA